MQILLSMHSKFQDDSYFFLLKFAKIEETLKRFIGKTWLVLVAELCKSVVLCCLTSVDLIIIVYN